MVLALVIDAMVDGFTFTVFDVMVVVHAFTGILPVSSSSHGYGSLF